MRAAPLEPVAEVGPPDRVSRLRERIIHAPREACVERARYLTRSMSAHWDEPPLTRMSRALEHILDNISVIIREDELVVGCRTSRLKGAPFFPENKSRWIEGDVDRFEERVIQKLRIGDAEARELKAEILPFWHGLENPIASVAKGKVKQGGNVVAMLKLLPVARRAFEMFPVALRELGYDHLVLTPREK